jgi:hypothetical protein
VDTNAVYQLLLSETSDNLRSYVSTYFDWYTFFWTLNLGALAWIYASDKDLPAPVLRNRRSIAHLFVFMNGLGTISSIAVAYLVMQMYRKIDIIGAAWRTQMPLDVLDALSNKLCAPDSVWIYAFSANAISTGAIGAVWFFIAQRECSSENPRIPIPVAQVVRSSEVESPDS